NSQGSFGQIKLEANPKSKLEALSNVALPMFLFSKSSRSSLPLYSSQSFDSIKKGNKEEVGKGEGRKGLEGENKKKGKKKGKKRSTKKEREKKSTRRKKEEKARSRSEKGKKHINGGVLISTSIYKIIQVQM
uniref:Uncharacterized protein n=1 Tax=Strongyloides stercoralis TaxID=6248 RepID=A0AAF5I367_STRER